MCKHLQALVNTTTKRLVDEIEALDALFAGKRASEPRRSYLGGSSIGHPCERMLWYYFRWCGLPEFPGRLLRLFDRGHRDEAAFADYLRQTGLELSTGPDPEDPGKQWRFDRLGGHFSAAPDGLLKRTHSHDGPAVWEFKTASKYSFDQTVKQGIRAKPEHFGQVQVSMGLAREDLGIPFGATLYQMVHKDSDNLHSEHVPFEPNTYEDLVRKAKRIVSADKPGPRYSEDPGKPPCKWCDYKDQCHEAQVADVNCKTCIHSTPNVRSGEWECVLHDVQIDSELLAKGCADHTYIPELVPFADVEGYDEQGKLMIYRNKEDGKLFCNGASTGFNADGLVQWSSPELKVLGPRATRESLKLLKQELGAEVKQ